MKTHILIFKHFPENLTTANAISIFSPFGKVNSLTIKKSVGGDLYGLVEYQESKPDELYYGSHSAYRATQGLKSYKFVGFPTLYLSPYMDKQVFDDYIQKRKEQDYQNLIICLQESMKSIET